MIVGNFLSYVYAGSQRCRQVLSYFYPRSKDHQFDLPRYDGGGNSVVECPLRMRKVPGSNPGTSMLTFLFSSLQISKISFKLKIQHLAKFQVQTRIQFGILAGCQSRRNLFTSPSIFFKSQGHSPNPNGICQNVNHHSISIINHHMPWPNSIF